MKFQSVDIEGQVHLQRVNTKPNWTPSDMGRCIYVKDEKILYYGTSEGWSRATGNGLRPVLVVENYTAEDQDLCLVDTREGPITITLPPNPKMGSQIAFIDVAGTFETHYCTIAANGKKIQRANKNFILDINDWRGDLVFDPLTASWKVNIDGIVQLLGNATVWCHKTLIVADELSLGQGQKQFNFEWEYNPEHDNISVYVDGVFQNEFEKTNTKSITLPEYVPKGTEVMVVSIPLEGAFNVNEFVTFTIIERDYVQKANLKQEILDIDGPGSGINADLLDDYQAVDFVRKVELLNEIKKVDAHGSGIDADTIDTFHASKAPAPNTVVVADEYGKIDPGYMPWGRGGFEIVSSYNIVGGSSWIIIPNLDNEAGYMLKIYNMSAEHNDVILRMRAYNQSVGAGDPVADVGTGAGWTGFERWSCQYTNHLSGGIREFNTDSDMLLANHVGSTTGGLNSIIYIDGFSSTSMYASRTVFATTMFQSTTGEYASLYQSLGTFKRSNEWYSALAVYFNSGLIGNTGGVTLYKFIK